jgi:cysteinyl-tRNA synthetase
MKKIKLYNTLTKQVEELKTLEPGKVKMYTCGITVYDHPHIGNWLAYTYSDVLHRTLLAAGYNVERAQNITDVGHLVNDEEDSGEDKMQKGARKEGLNAWQVADKYIKICEEESTKLNLLKPAHLVRATDLIAEQIKFVKELEAKGYTYQLADGVYFDTSKLKDYGKLAGLDISGLKDGARVADVGKKNKTDFALWKLSAPGEKRDMEWESPWGVGFPGWHLECSVIARETLGDQIDIHTGGIDHIPVHHTNEIAQTESLTEKIPFSGCWFHNNHIKVNGTKISKSLGNVFTLSDIEEKGFSLDAFKLMVLSSHYQTEGNFSWEILEAAQNRLSNWYEAGSARCAFGGPSKNCELNSEMNSVKEEALSYMFNNLNTPSALASIDKWSNLILDCLEKGCYNTKKMTEFVDFINEYLGISIEPCPEDISINGEIQSVESVIARRAEARANKDWAESDKIRDLLLEQGIKLKDTKQGQVWSK